MFLARTCRLIQSFCKLFMFASLFALPVSLLGQSWAAATGVVDPAGAARVHVSSAGNVYVDASAPVPTTGILRYNLFQAGIDPRPLQQGECWQMVARYSDNGAGAEVVLQLKRYNLHTGALTTLLTFDSNAFAASSGFQYQASPCIPFDFEFANNAAFPPGPASVYFVEAKLIRTSGTGVPKLAGFGLLRIIP